MFHQIPKVILSLVIVMFAAQSSFAQTSFAIMGDVGEAGKELDRLRASVKKEQLKNLIMPGDNLYSGTYQKVWDVWKADGFDFTITAIGNHTDGYAEEVAYFNLPGEYFSVVKGGARFIVLNSDNTKNIQEQFNFLNKEMAAAKEKLVFLVYHHPTFTLTSKHKWTEKRDFQLKMREFLRQNGQKISAIILGHDHITTFVEFGTIPVILAGAGRDVRPAKAVSFPEDGFQIETRYLAPQNQHYVRMDVNAAGDEAQLNVIRVSDNAKVCAATLRQNAISLSSNCKP
jgi:hypothetical protein